MDPLKELVENTSVGLIGLSKADAIKKIKDSKLKSRVTREDKDIYSVTMELNETRINLEIDNGIVTKITTG